ncbi:MAG: PEGA domain-containing protein [Myxococcales bacterium]|nr:PEGA domain-containing protein [Myxococcales bacterium]
MPSTPRLVLFLLMLPLSALAVERPDVLVVIGAGSSLPDEFEDDVGEPLSFTLSKSKELAFAFLPMDRVRTELGYGGAMAPGSCVFDNECLRKTRASLGADRFIVVKLAGTEAEVDLTVTRITDSSVTDVSRTQKVQGGAAEVINVARGLAIEVLEERRATVVVTVNEPDAIIEVGGVRLPEGKRRLEVKPGSYRITVSKPDFTPFETTLTCRPGEQCAASASIFPLRQDDLGGATNDTLSRSLVISGWSAAGVGAVLTAVGIVYGLRSQELSDELDAACIGTSAIGRSVCDLTRSEADDKAAEGREAARIFNGAGITGMVLLVAGITTAAVGHGIAPDDTSVEVAPVSMGDGYGLLGTVRF